MSREACTQGPDTRGRHAPDRDGHQGLATQGLTLSYHPAHPVAEDLSVTVEPGQVTVIVGPNACGKSTLLRALSRVITPDAGRVLLDGRDIATLRPRQLARKVSMLAQSSTAPEGITVHELVTRGRYPYQSLLQQWSAEDDEAVTQAMQRTGTADLARRRVSSLSGGQRQRAWIAMALARRTDVLLLDEPTTYLDLAHQVEVLELCRELNEELGTTVVAVLHDLNQACRYGDRLIAMREGRVLASGAPGEVVTAELVEAVFGLRVRLLDDPLTGTPLVLPLPRQAPAATRRREMVAETGELAPRLPAPPGSGYTQDMTSTDPSPEAVALRRLIDTHRDELQVLLARYGATRPRLFGSVARGTANRDSDIDILVEMDPSDGNLLMRSAGLMEEARALFGRNNVDVFPVQLLREPVSQSALRDAVEL